MTDRLRPRTIDLPSRAAGPEIWTQFLKTLLQQEQTPRVKKAVEVARKRLAILARGGN